MINYNLSLDKIYVAIDFETADRLQDSACAVGMAKIVNGKIADSFYSLIKPPRKKVFFTHIHNLTWEDLKDSESFSSVWPKMKNFVKDADYFIAHNASFDKGVLDACCDSFGFERVNVPFLCTLKFARHALKLKSNKLNVLCEHFNIPLNHHDAASDAVGAASIFLRLNNL